MICQFLTHTVDINRNNLIQKLATKDILSPGERHKIKEQRTAGTKMSSLITAMRDKSAAEFESFLTTLSETGQPSLVHVVWQALLTVGKTGQNPLQSVCGKKVYYGHPIR